jgi:hypothetical protein
MVTARLAAHTSEVKNERGKSSHIHEPLSPYLYRVCTRFTTADTSDAIRSRR